MGPKAAPKLSWLWWLKKGLTKNNLFKEKSVSKKEIRREEELHEEKRRKEGSLTLMKRTINSPTGFSPVEKEKRTTSPTMHRN